MTTRTYDATGRRVQVLVVDDDQGQASAVGTLLDLEGYDVRIALSGVDALQHIDGWAPDVVLLDISMPVHDGFATARIFRRLARTRDVVLIAHTALMLEHVTARSRDGDFDAYFQKGSPVDMLVDLLR